MTRESLKPGHPSPFDALTGGWHTHERTQPWQVWDSMVEPTAGTPQAPCQTACPAGTDAGRYVGLIAEGRYSEAYAVAAEVNPFPSVCGWICTAPCEVACRRGTLDEPIAIRTLKRFAAEHGTLPELPPPPAKRSERVAIVGGGPAGMSAAYYLARLGYPVTVFEAMPVPGGMMAIGIPEYRLPREVLRAEIDRIVGLGVDLRLNQAMGRDFSLADLEAQGFGAIFLSTGAPKSRRLGVSGDQLKGVVPATLFLKQVNLGEKPALERHRSRGRGWLHRDGRSPLGAAQRGSIGHRPLPAQPRRYASPGRGDRGRGARGGRDPNQHAVVDEVLGQDGRMIGARVVVSEGGTEAQPETVTASTILVAIGEEPDPSILPEGTGIEISAFAGIVADPKTLATGHAGVFAGGDVVSGPKTIIDAVASGRRAAAAIHAYLRGIPDGEAAVMAAARYRTAPPRSLELDLAIRPRAHPAEGEYVPGSFKATQQGFTDAVARGEANRCFRCDAVYSCPAVSVAAGRGRSQPTGADVSAATSSGGQQ